jgi:flavin-dependent dehydrogenase
MSKREVYDVIIIGGGLAGCTAAYHLQKRGFCVALLEGKTYPCDRLCGETLSPKAWQSFEAMQISREIEALNPAKIDRVLVTATSGKHFCGKLPGVGIGLSRYHLDWTLWNHCEAAGVSTIGGFKVQQITGRLGDGFSVSAAQKHHAPETFSGRSVIAAFGKRSNLDRLLHRRFWVQRHGYVAFKAHYEGIELGQTVELHGFRGGYCGLCHIESKKINLCLIVKESIFRSVRSQRKRLFDEILRENPRLGARLDAMKRISPRFISIGQIAFTRKTLWESDIMMVGDAAQLITPLCGDGMAMAMRSGELCAGFVADYLNEAISSQQLKEQHCGQWEKEFRTRLGWGHILQFVLFQPMLASVAVRLLHRGPWLADFLIRQTRDTRSAASHLQNPQKV